MFDYGKLSTLESSQYSLVYRVRNYFLQHKQISPDTVAPAFPGCLTSPYDSTLGSSNTRGSGRRISHSDPAPLLPRTSRQEASDILVIPGEGRFAEHTISDRRSSVDDSIDPVITGREESWRKLQTRRTFPGFANWTGSIKTVL